MMKNITSNSNTNSLKPRFWVGQGDKNNSPIPSNQEMNKPAILKINPNIKEK